MKWLEKNYDRLILLLVAVAALAVSGLLITSSLGFGERFVRPEPPRSAELAETGIERITATEELLEETFAWQAPVIAGRPIRLNTSVTIVERADEVGGGNVTIDMEAPGQPQLRPPMTNEWLLEHNLDFLRSDIGDLDSDGDGFTNLEEFEAGTNPRDPASHPPFTDKLFVTEKVPHPYVLVFQGGAPPTMQIRRVEPNTTSQFLDIGGTAFRDDNRFVLQGYEAKTDPDARPGQQDVSEVEVEDTVRGETFILVRGQQADRGDNTAVFTYTLKGEQELRVRERNTFSLPNDPSVTYKLIDVNDSRALISPLDAAGNPSGEVSIPWK